jgi:hypothetical protein
MATGQRNGFKAGVAGQRAVRPDDDIDAAVTRGRWAT